MRNINLHFLLILLLGLHLSSVFSWKKDEFRNCDETPFCKRARARKPGSCSLVAHDVSISNGDLISKLISKSRQNQEDQNSSRPLILTLSLYQKGIMRLKIDQDLSRGMPKKRFEVPDVIVPEFAGKKLELQRLSTETIGRDAVPSSVVYLLEGYEVVLRHDLFEVYVRDKQANV